MYLLDTDWIIQALGGREPAAQTLRQLAGSRIHISIGHPWTLGHQVCLNARKAAYPGLFTSRVSDTCPAVISSIHDPLGRHQA